MSAETILTDSGPPKSAAALTASVAEPASRAGTTGMPASLSSIRASCSGSEHDARMLLSDAGIPVVPARLAGSATEAVKAAADFGGPLSVKIVSADILHKSDIGGVVLDVPAGEEAVRAAYQA